MGKIITLGMLVLSLTGCVTTQMAAIPHQNTNEPEVFMTQMPGRQYTEIGYIEAAGNIFHTKKKLLANLRERAKKENADALVNVRFEYTFWWPYVAGVAIKYGDDKSERSNKE